MQIESQQNNQALLLSAIQTNGGTQGRAQLDERTVQDYAQDMQSGALFPPVVVFYDGEVYWLADGFHRVAAALSIGQSYIQTELRQGTRRDAVLHSVGANGAHGLRRTNEDKRRAVQLLLADPEWQQWSDSEIARRCGVHQTFASDMRRSLKSDLSENRNYITRYGTPATMNVANIGMPSLSQSALSTYDDALPMDYDNVDVTTGEIVDSRIPALRALQSSESNEWYTPAPYIEAARALMGAIDLDPASNPTANQIVKAETYYTIQDDGFAKEWKGSVWLNPPYGRDEGESNQEKWSARLIAEHAAGNVTQAVLLVNAVTDRRWFQPLWDFPICFTDHRIRFYSPDTEAGQPTHGNVLVYFGADIDAFYRNFHQFGPIVPKVLR